MAQQGDAQHWHLLDYHAGVLCCVLVKAEVRVSLGLESRRSLHCVGSLHAGAQHTCAGHLHYDVRVAHVAAGHTAFSPRGMHDLRVPCFLSCTVCI